MKILLVNDDGIHAKGIYALAKELEKEHDITIVAPDDQRSASSHSITIFKPLVVKKVKLEGLKAKAFSVSGTPADCVRIAIDKLIDKDIDFVISGINRGVNLGNDVLYSGTVSAAIEAALNKIPSIAVSVHIKEDIEEYSVAAKYASKVLDIAIKNKLEEDVVLNINVPLLKEEEIKGIKVCRIGEGVYDSIYIESENESEDSSFILTAKLKKHDSTDTDIYYIKQGYVTVTPLHYDLTNFKIMHNVENWLK